MTNELTKREAMMNFARQQSTETLKDVVRQMSGEAGESCFSVSREERTEVRVVALDVIEEREGGEAVDALLDELGL